MDREAILALWFLWGVESRLKRTRHLIALLLIVAGGGFRMGTSLAARGALGPCVDNGVAIDRESHVFFRDELTERLALRLSTGLHADRAIYDRLVRDLSAIRAPNPQLREVRYRPPSTDNLIITLTAEGRTQFEEHRFTQWKCLNRYLGVSAVREISDRSLMLTLGGIFRGDLVERWYRTLPGVEGASMEATIGDGSNIYVVRESDVWRYLFDIAGGDCLAGCTEHNMWYFEIATNGRSGSPKHLYWRVGDPLPRWVAATLHHYG